MTRLVKMFNALLSPSFYITAFTNPSPVIAQDSVLRDEYINIILDV